MVQTKKKWLIAGVAALALTAALYTQNLPSPSLNGQVYAAEQTAEASKRIITVNGQGEMTITPDVAYINLGIRTQAATAQEAQAANAEAYAKLRSVLFDEYKLAAKDVQTSGFNVNPEYTYTDRDPKIKGYTATQMLQVTYRDLDKLGTFLDAASGAGANSIEGVRFSTEKGQEYELQVIEKAMDNAKAKAEKIAKYAGKELKGIVAVNQGGGVSAPVAYGNIGGMAKLESAAMDMAIPTQISTGELKVTTTVTVQYEF